jgi:2-(3-amino-3-carboxypropyl)histidine synthase
MKQKLSYEIDFNVLKDKCAQCTRVLLKIPEGLRHLSHTISEFLEKEGKTVTISANSCYGACDFHEALTDIDKVIYIGEAEMPYVKEKLPNRVDFVEVYAPYAIKEVVCKAFPLLKGKKIGVTTITPYIPQMDACYELLKNEGFIAIVGKKGRRTAYDGQILGCDLTAGTSIGGNVESFLHIGDGFFHPLGLAFSTAKEVVAADPSQGKVVKKEIAHMKNKILKKRYAIVAEAMQGKKVGIILCEKLGQQRLELAYRLKKVAMEKNFRALLLTLNNISPEKIDYFDVDFFISTACPRIAIDDAILYKKPLLTPIEAEIIFDERNWNNYEFDQIL